MPDKRVDFVASKLSKEGPPVDKVETANATNEKAAESSAGGKAGKGKAKGKGKESDKDKDAAGKGKGGKGEQTSRGWES